MMELIEQSQVALDEVIDVAGRAMIEALLRLSAEGMAGPPHPGKKGGAIGWHGREQGTVCLKERKLRGKRSEEHTSELQSQSNLVCRLLLEKKKKKRPETPESEIKQNNTQ